jgi:hypothetical protein
MRQALSVSGGHFKCAGHRAQALERRNRASYLNW